MTENSSGRVDADLVARARGCLAGQLAGDALGSLVEFQSPEQIRGKYPDGVRKLADGGTWNTLAGQPTDDSEMALLLARLLVKTGTYDPEAARKEYRYWLSSGPFDCGNTIYAGLTGSPNTDSQANGAMMRVSPLGIFGASHDLEQVAEWATQDAALTHPHLICRQANALFAMALAHAVSSGCASEELFLRIRNWAKEMPVEPALMTIIDKAASEPPTDFVCQQGWVLIAFQNALYRLLHAQSFEAGVVATIMGGGDTDTNAAICGALLGAVHGLAAVPDQWIDSLENCRPSAKNSRVFRPRPQCFWPVDVLDLAEKLIGRQGGKGGKKYRNLNDEF